MSVKFSILITTKNRLTDLKLTLQKTAHLIKKEDVECIICDDGSNDDTFQLIKKNHPKISLTQNPISKGLIFSRNRWSTIKSHKYHIVNKLDDFTLKQEIVNKNRLSTIIFNNIKPFKKENSFIIFIKRIIGRFFMKFKWIK